MTGVETAVAIGSLASAAIGAAGSIAAGNAQQAALNRNAEVGKVNAGAALNTSEADAQRLQLRTQRSVASGVNNTGASGVDLSTGSPLDVMADTAAQGTLDSEIARWRGRTQADAYLTGSNTSIMQGQQASTAGEIQGATTLLTSGARYAQSRLPLQTAS